MITTLQATTIEHFGTGKQTNVQARWIAGKLFDRAYMNGKFIRFWTKLTGKKNALLRLTHRSKADHPTTGIVVVPLSKIVGTEGRNDDFDASFRPLKLHNRERWISVAAALRTGITLPAVELLKVGDEYYVRDGHHRISVAKILGQLEIDARIVN